MRGIVGDTAPPGQKPPGERSVVERWDLDLPEQLDLGLEDDAEAFACAATRLADEGERVRRPRPADVLDEVRVLRARSARRRSGSP